MTGNVHEIRLTLADVENRLMRMKMNNEPYTERKLSFRYGDSSTVKRTPSSLANPIKGRQARWNDGDAEYGKGLANEDTDTGDDGDDLDEGHDDYEDDDDEDDDDGDE